jgi:hypothetical protein
MGRWWFGCAYLAPLLLLHFFPPTPLPSRPIPNPPFSPLMGWVKRWHACSGRERDADLSCLAEFQTPTFLNCNFDFHSSISYSDPKIVKIIVCIHYICKDVSMILNLEILICGGVYMVILFQSYEISIYIEKMCWF